MDGLDVRLLRALGARPFASAAPPLPERGASALARRLHVTRNTVAERTAALERAGVIEGWQAYPNLRQLGIEFCTFHAVADTEGLKREAVRRLPLVEGVGRVLDFLGRDVCFDLYYSSPRERERRLKLCSELTGGPAARALEARPMPQPARPMAPADWRLVQALRGRGRRPILQVARDLGTTYRTAKRRFDALVAAKNLDIVPLINAGRIPNAIPLGIMFRLEAAKREPASAAILRLLDERYFFFDIPPDPTLGHFAVQAFASSAADLEEMRAACAAVPGVQETSISLVAGMKASEAWLDEAIAARAVVPAR